MIRSRTTLLMVPLIGVLVFATAQDRDAPSNEQQSPEVASEIVAVNQPRDFSQTARASTSGERPTTDRAFLYAPPPIPHSILTENDSNYCLKCHALENRVSEHHMAIAPVPHAEFSQCLQCHVKGDDKSIAPFRENEFVGLDFPGGGMQANVYAPPTIPHKTFMRENCLSCHGPTGDRTIRTPHPERTQCQQCHVPEASQSYTRPIEWTSLTFGAVETAPPKLEEKAAESPKKL